MTGQEVIACFTLTTGGRNIWVCGIPLVQALVSWELLINKLGNPLPVMTGQGFLGCLENFFIK
jgi:hypothetical protein